jgi:myosin heavy subunit
VCLVILSIETLRVNKTQAFKPGELGKVALMDDSGKTSIFEIELDPTITQTLTKMDEESLGADQEDMVDLKELNDASIMHNLRLRFLKDDIYTSIGDVLIATNPFKVWCFV